MERMTADDLKNEASETLSSATAEARRRMGGLVDWGKEQAARLKDPAANVWNSSMDYVKANPGKTIIVSLAIGVVIGTLLSRRRGD